MVGYKAVTKTKNPDIFHSINMDRILALNVEYSINKEATPNVEMLKLGLGLYIFDTLDNAKIFLGDSLPQLSSILEVDYDFQNLLTPKLMMNLAYYLQDNDISIDVIKMFPISIHIAALPTGTLMVSKLTPRKVIER